MFSMPIIYFHDCIETNYCARFVARSVKVLYQIIAGDASKKGIQCAHVETVRESDRERQGERDSERERERQ